MAYVLGLAHASNIVFFTALRESGIPFAELRGAASTTFRRCLDACTPTSEEDSRLYHEIQRLNANTPGMWDAYERALRAVRDASLSDGPEGFARLMESGKDYLRE